MPAKRPKAQNGVTGERKISSFFKPDGMPLEIAGKKRIREEGPFSESVQEDYLSPPPSKKSPSSSPPNGSENEVSPEQKLRMERNRLEAEARVIAKKFGAEKLGLTWVKALLVEFKKPYMQEQKMSFLGPQPVQLMKFEESENEIWEHNFHCSSIVQAQDPGNDTDAIFKVKVVILGQDPYHGPNQAHGLCFSVRVGVSIPPSLQNMYKELSSDIEGFKLPDHGYLMGWAKQGVLLLNACLTVRAREANSHAGKGWENVTDAVIHWLNDRTAGLVFLLWGSHAQKKGSFINKKKHCVLKSPHPSPLSAHRGFLGCKHFSQTNTYLRQQGKKPIDWSYLPKTMDD